MAKTMIHIKSCPTCGSTRIKLVRRKWTRSFQGKPYTVPNLEFHECPDCRERVYDPEAMRKIEARSPAFCQIPTRKRSA